MSGAFSASPFDFPVSLALQPQRAIIEHIAPSPAKLPRRTRISIIDSKIRVNPRNPRFLFLLVIRAFGFRYCFGFLSAVVLADRASDFEFLLLCVLCLPCVAHWAKRGAPSLAKIRTTNSVNQC